MIRINIEGKEIAKSIVDLFSPLTEIAGTIGDQIRIYRNLSVIRTLQKAKAKADKENLILKPPPLRFLISYLEQASLQDEGNENLNELWTNLLLSAATDFKSEHNLFIRILNELSPKEALAFQYITKSHGSKPYDGFSFAHVQYSYWNDSYFYIAIRDLLSEYKGQDLHDIDHKLFHKKLLKRYQTPGSFIYYFSIGSGEINKFPQETVFTPGRSDFDNLFEDISFSLLKNHGLIDEFISSDYWFEDLVYDLRAYYLTPLGESFYSSCIKIDS